MADTTKLKALDAQLKQIGCNFRFWGRPEIRELAHILLPGEQVRNCLNGQYEGGFALLCATDQRILLIDKKPMFLTVEDIRFDMIAELDYNHRLLNATIHVSTPNQVLRFTAYNQGRLREFFMYVQQRVMEIRQHYMHQIEREEQIEAVAPALAAPASQMQSVPPTTFSEPFLASQQPQQPTAGDQLQQGQRQPLQRRMVAPIISAYTRLPLMSRQRRYLGSRAMNTPLPSIYDSRR